MSAYGVKVNDNTVRFERLLPGPIERVFQFLWDEDKRKLWFTTGVMPKQPGERFTMHWHHRNYSPNPSTPPEHMKEIDEKGHSDIMTLLAYEPPHRLAYTFGESKHPDRPSEVEFVLTQEGDQVRLVLTHSKVPDHAYALGVSRGWHSHLDVLEHQIKGETPPGFWDIFARYDGVYARRYA
jgi:uncharacterized protein YndB with AHSA1/START domain